MRVCRILPITSATAPTRIIVSLANIPIGSSVRYKALSYVWGNDDVQRTIDVVADNAPGTQNATVRQTGTLLVRENLYNFLLQYRSNLTGILEPLFVDALCINQQDVSERNSQVAAMKRIFSNAQLVIAWLAVEDEYSRRLFAAIQVAATPASRWKSHIRRQITTKKPNLLKSNTQLLPCFHAVFRRGFFYRTWIIQEIAHATEIEVWCGPDKVSWYDFTNGPCSMRAYCESITTTWWLKPDEMILWAACIDCGGSASTRRCPCQDCCV